MAAGSVMYNVKVLGYSVGITSDRRIAEQWVSRRREAVIYPMTYHVPDYAQIMARLGRKA